MASPLTLGAAADLVNVAIQKIWLKENPTLEEKFRKVYNVTTGVSDYYLKDSSLSGLGSASRMVEQATIVSEAPTQGFDQSYTQIAYAKIMGFSWYLWKFGIKKRDLTRIVRALKTACVTAREEMLMEKLDAAYLSSYTRSDDGGNYTVTTTGGDGNPLAYASHSREDGKHSAVNLISCFA